MRDRRARVLRTRIGEAIRVAFTAASGIRVPDNVLIYGIPYVEDGRKNPYTVNPADVAPHVVQVDIVDADGRVETDSAPCAGSWTSDLITLTILRSCERAAEEFGDFDDASRYASTSDFVRDKRFHGDRFSARAEFDPRVKELYSFAFCSRSGRASSTKLSPVGLYEHYAIHRGSCDAFTAEEARAGTI